MANYDIYGGNRGDEGGGCCGCLMFVAIGIILWIMKLYFS